MPTRLLGSDGSEHQEPGADLGTVDLAQEAVGLNVESVAHQMKQRVSANLDALEPEAFIQEVILRRFDENLEIPSHTAENRALLEEKLRTHPEQVAALYQMEISGGAPDFIDVRDGQVFFEECPDAELPSERTDLSYSDAVLRAQAMGGGAKLRTPERFRELKALGLSQGEKTGWVWLYAEDPAMLERGVAPIGNPFLDEDDLTSDPDVGENELDNHSAFGGFLCSLSF